MSISFFEFQRWINENKSLLPDFNANEENLRILFNNEDLRPVLNEFYKKLRSKERLYDIQELRKTPELRTPVLKIIETNANIQSLQNKYLNLSEKFETRCKKMSENPVTPAMEYKIALIDCENDMIKNKVLAIKQLIDYGDNLSLKFTNKSSDSDKENKEISIVNLNEGAVEPLAQSTARRLVNGLERKMESDNNYTEHILMNFMSKFTATEMLNTITSLKNENRNNAEKLLNSVNHSYVALEKREELKKALGTEMLNIGDKIKQLYKETCELIFKNRDLTKLIIGNEKKLNFIIKRNPSLSDTWKIFLLQKEIEILNRILEEENSKITYDSKDDNLVQIINDGHSKIIKLDTRIRSLIKSMDEVRNHTNVLRNQTLLFNNTKIPKKFYIDNGLKLFSLIKQKSNLITTLKYEKLLTEQKDYVKIPFEQKIALFSSKFAEEMAIENNLKQNYLQLILNFNENELNEKSLPDAMIMNSISNHQVLEEVNQLETHEMSELENTSLDYIRTVNEWKIRINILEDFVKQNFKVDDMNLDEWKTLIEEKLSSGDL